MTPEALRQLHEARARSKKIRRAVTVAHFDGWCVAIFAGLTLMGSAVSFSFPGMLVGIGMGAVAWIEFTSARQLVQLDPASIKRLAWNQLFLAGILLAYAAYALWTGLRDPAAYAGVVSSQLNDPELARMVGPIENLVRWLLLAIYGTLAFVAITVQGSTALYYLTRGKHLRAYLEQTPRWILDAQRSGLPI